MNVLSICSDDELMSDGDDGLEEGNVHYHIARPRSSFNTTTFLAEILLSLSIYLPLHIYINILLISFKSISTGPSYIVIRVIPFVRHV